MKNVAYLIGAGATQGELEYNNIDADTSMKGISDNVLKMSKNNGAEYYKLFQDFSLPPEQDIELTISLFESFTAESTAFKGVHKELRELFRKYLITEINKKSFTPRLSCSLLYLHMKYGKLMGDNGEDLLGILTTNYDSIFEKAFMKLYKGLNCGCKFISEDYKMDSTIPPLLKLHGSFNWKITQYLEVSKQFEQVSYLDDYSGWIPPSVYKKPSAELFQDIWNKSKQILDNCDILRVIGSSLRNEDWCLISLIFTSQISRKKANGKAFNIELIVPQTSTRGDENHPGILQRLPFLTNLKSLVSLPVYDLDLLQDNVYYNWLVKKGNEIDRKKRIVGEDKTITNMLYREE